LGIQKNISSSLVYQIGISLLNFMITILITRIIGANGRGDVAIYNNAVAIATTVFGISMSSALVYFIASKKLDAQQAFSIICVASFGGFIFVSLACLLLYYFQFQLSITPFSTNGFLLIYFVAHVVFSIFNINISALLNAKEIFIFPLRLQFIQLCILLIGLILASYHLLSSLHLTTSKIVCFIIFLYVLQTIILLIYTLQKCNISLFAITIIPSVAKQLFAFSAMAFACNAVQMCSYRMDLWFLKYYHTASIVGVYSIAVLFVQMLWIMPNQITAVLYTKFNQHQQSPKLIEFITKITALSFWIFFIVFCVCWLLSFMAIPLLFGKAFAESAILLGILLIGAIPIASALMISTYFASANLLRYNLIGSMIGFVVCIFLNFLWIPKYGYYGASFASVFAYLSNCIYLYYQFCKTNRVNFTELFLPNIAFCKNLKTAWHEL
jgi:O-antigen/teichoic acid export membrane protein